MNSEFSHPTVGNGDERARMISAGLIRFDPPRQPGFAQPLTADQLARRGFDDAARHKRAHEAAMAEWSAFGGFGFRPRRD